MKVGNVVMCKNGLRYQVNTVNGEMLNLTYVGNGDDGSLVRDEFCTYSHVHMDNVDYVVQESL